MMDSLPAADVGRVVIAISAFRSDPSIVSLLEKLFAPGEQAFGQVIVVDSLGDGALEATIARAGWAVLYHNADRNLGSAGNLALRLRLAAQTDADWCFAINHDGSIDRDMIRALVAKGSSEPRVGAVFPKRVFTDRGHTVFAPHRSVFAMPRVARRSRNRMSDEVAWDSSNGALYALRPIREGVVPWGDLWMGWEDLAFGWCLSNASWRQLRCDAVEFADNYEYEQVRLFGKPFYIARKPSWYAYYVIRNLMLFARRSRSGARGWRLVGSRLCREVVLTLLYRTEKMHRLRLLGRGFLDGLAGVTGKGP